MSGQPSYRDTQLPGIGIVTGLSGGLFISPLSGVPDFIVPLGQVRYNSSVTHHPEFLPVTINNIAAGGCDLMLLDLINDLNEAGIIPTIQTGTSIFGGATYLSLNVVEAHRRDPIAPVFGPKTSITFTVDMTSIFVKDLSRNHLMILNRYSSVNIGREK